MCYCVDLGTVVVVYVQVMSGFRGGRGGGRGTPRGGGRGGGRGQEGIDLILFTLVRALVLASEQNLWYCLFLHVRKDAVSIAEYSYHE